MEAIDANYAASASKYPKRVLCDGEGGGGKECQAAAARYLAAVPQLMQLLYAHDAEVLQVEAAALEEERAAVAQEVRRSDDLLRAAQYGSTSQELGNPYNILMLDQHTAGQISTLATRFADIVKRAAFATHCGPKYLGDATHPNGTRDCYGQK